MKIRAGGLLDLIRSLGDVCRELPFLPQRPAMQHDSPDGILSGIRCEWAAQYRLERCRFAHITRPWFMSRLSMIIGDMVKFNLRPTIHELSRTVNTLDETNQQ
jgi:hypothetical protein